MPGRSSLRKRCSYSETQQAIAIMSEDNNNPLTLRWEVEDKKRWFVYPDDVVKALNEAVDRDEKIVTLTSGKNTTLTVHTVRLTQRNVGTGWEKQVRCAANSAQAQSNDYYVWQWQDENSKWICYPPAVTKDLETSFSNSKVDIKFKIGSRDYQVDLQSMEQVNVQTDMRRSVQRVQSDAEEYDGKNRSLSGLQYVPDESPTRQTSKGGKRKKAAVVEASTSNGTSTEENNKTVIMKGKAPVDSECPLVSKSHVFYEGEEIWDCMLNQTNVQFNNNKYYLIQLLEDDNRKNYTVWMRWGRVGFKGQNSTFPCGTNLEEAKGIFKKKFSNKTKNNWEERDNFEKVPGKYDLLAMDYSTDSKDEPDTKKVKKEEPEEPPKVEDSKLDMRVQELIKLICDIRAMEEAVIEMKYDTQKAPLGKLTENQIRAGYAALKEIDDLVKLHKIGSPLVQACNDYYTRIPHSFGMKVPPLLRTRDDIKRELDLLDTLGDIQIAINILKDDDNSLSHPVDRQYNSLHCELIPLEAESNDYNLISSYLKTTHGKTHNMYKMKVVSIFECSKVVEQSQFSDVGNRMLLWHGSRLTNWAGILAQGLRIAPPEAPSTGYMFGKGIYFADISSKSANYCLPGRSQNTGLLVLCEVALGKEHELIDADYEADQLPAGTNSVKGLGEMIPDPSKKATLSNGTIVPLGPIIKNKNRPNGYTLNYNEYVVYNTNQVKMKYLVKVKFTFK